MSQVREGIRPRAVARSFRVSLSTVPRWVARAEDWPLNEVDGDARPAGCRVSPRRTKAGVEQRVLVIRRQLRTQSDLGEYGPEALQRARQQRGERVIPAMATLARILSRRGAVDGRKRVRRKAPPPGWFLSDVADKRAETDNFDALEDLVIRGGIDVNVLTGIRLHGGRCAAWPPHKSPRTSRSIAGSSMGVRWDFPATRRSITARSFTELIGGPTAWAESLGCACRGKSPRCSGVHRVRAAVVPRISSRHRSLQPTLARGGLVARHVPHA